MNPFYIQNRKLLEQEITQQIKVAIKNSQNNHVWAKDALTRFGDFVLPGKMIRGLLVVLAAEPKTIQQKRDAVKIGAMLEMMHSGILIHDDIMDRDEARRGVPTIHTQYRQNIKLGNKQEELHYGESMASCVGIIAYFLAINQFAQLNNSKVGPQLIKLFSSEMVLLGAAQMDDVHSATSKDRATEENILRVYEQKTGRYTFALPLLAGLILQNRLTTASQKLIFQLAKNLGLIFQLKDDCLGVFGDSAQTGKSVGGDIREKKQTWLYFELLKRCTATEAKSIKALYETAGLMSQKGQKQILELLQKYQIEAFADKKIRNAQKIVIKDIAKLPLGKTSKQALVDLTDFLINRVK